jgi:hypothetical protein
MRIPDSNSQRPPHGNVSLLAKHVPKPTGWISTILLPSGKHTKNYGKSPFLMGKSTINGHFQ